MMKTLLLIVFFVFILSKKYEFEFDEEVEKRNPPLHGATLMNRGFDFRQGGQVPPHPKSEIFEFTPSNKIYRVPGRPDLVFSVPKEVEVTNRAQHIERSSSEIFHSYQQTVTIDIGGFNFGIGLQYGNFGIGARYGMEYGRIRDRLTQKYRATGRSLYYTSGYSCLAMPYPFLKQSEIFKQVIDFLPTRPQTPEDMEKVQIFLDYYGGFFVWNGVFGGQIRQFQFLTREVVERRDQSWIQQQFHLEFHYNLFNLTAGGFRNRSQIVIDNFFKLNSESELVFTGGFRNLQTNRTLVEWDRSIDDSPELLTGSFRPISDLISNNPEKKRNLEFMIKHYSNTGQLKAPPAAIRVNGQKKIPGYDIIGSGFDTMEMITRRSVFVHDEEGFKRTTTWRNPFYPEHEFSVPSSINLRQRTESTEQNFTDISMTKSEYEVKYANRWSSSGFLGMSRRSYEVYYYLNRFEFFNEYSISHRRQLSWYDLTLNPLIYFNQEMTEKYMDPDLKYMIDHLEADYDKPGAKMYYRAIIDFWGTDFVTHAVMGGVATTDLYFKKDLIRSHEISRIIQQSSFSFFGIINSRSYNFRNDTNVSQWLRENAHIRTRFIGGRYNPNENTQKTPWQSFTESLRSEPTAINYKFIPISFLIKDPTKQRNMNRAIDEYKKEKMHVPGINI